MENCLNLKVFSLIAHYAGLGVGINRETTLLIDFRSLRTLDLVLLAPFVVVLHICSNSLVSTSGKTLVIRCSKIEISAN